MATNIGYKIGKAQAAQTYTLMDSNTIGNNIGRKVVPGYYDPSTPQKKSYHDQIKIIRWFYENDPIAGTVVNRMADMAITTVRNRKKTKRNADQVPEEIMAYFDALVVQLRPFLKLAALEFLVHGMAVPDYTFQRLRGDKIAEKLGRKRYTTIDQIWVRNPEHLLLKKRPTGMDRQVLLKVPPEDIAFIQNKGTRTDGTEDKEAYQYLVENFPEYVRAVQNGKNVFPLDNVRAILRKITSYNEYPTPFLNNALTALQHKAYLKTMDRSIASRAIEAIRLVKTGDKDFPADDDDIAATKSMVEQNSSTGERIFNLFTNHTVTIDWIFPPLEALLNEQKYAEPNADIFLGLGFPRILTVGETLRSNASDSKIASLGPKSTLDDLRDALTAWLVKLYEELSEKNNFPRVPEPYFAPIATTDYTALVQFAIQALEAGAISKDTVSQLYGSDYETEAGQIETEQEMGVLSPSELAVEKQQEFQVQQTERNQEFTREQTDKNQEFVEKQSKQDAKNKPAGAKEK